MFLTAYFNQFYNYIIIYNVTKVITSNPRIAQFSTESRTISSVAAFEPAMVHYSEPIVVK